MRVLVLGSSGATHAIVWKLFETNKIQQLAAMPGNAGIGLISPIANSIEHVEELVQWLRQEAFDLVIPTTSDLLIEGLTDEAADFSVAISGPPQRSAFFETSRLWTREFINRVNLPAMPGRAFTDLKLAERYLAAQTLPVNLYADIASEYDGAYTERGQAMNALKEMFALPPQPHSMRGVVIETPAIGPSVALSCFTDGTRWHTLLPVRMYDRLEDNDQGWHASGMGAHTNTGGMLEQVGTLIDAHILDPLIKALKQEAIPWWGILGVDCAITTDGPKLLRIRTTLNEPEAQVILPRLEEDLIVLYAACHNRALDQIPSLRWKHTASVAVTIVQKGYPYQPGIESPINGISELQGVLNFQHHTLGSNSMEYVPYYFDEQEARSLGKKINFKSTARKSQPLGLGMDNASSGMNTSLFRIDAGTVTATKPRMLTLVGMGNSLQAARELVYQEITKIQTPLGYYRTDIGAREL